MSRVDRFQLIVQGPFFSDPVQLVQSSTHEEIKAFRPVITTRVYMAYIAVYIACTGITLREAGRLFEYNHPDIYTYIRDNCEEDCGKEVYEVLMGIFSVNRSNTNRHEEDKIAHTLLQRR